MASTASSQSPLLVPRGVLEGKPAIPVSRPVWIIGSRKGCHLQLESQHVSQAHAVIVNTGRGLFIKDLGSREHTYVNRLPVKEVQLGDGDKVQIGPFKFYFKDPTANPGDRPPVAPLSLLRVLGERIPVPIESRVTLIGRKTGSDVTLTEESVSTSHALLIDIDGEYYVRDLGSRTGTFLNGQKIRGQAPLSPGDVIKVGETEMTFDHVVQPTEESERESSGDSLIAVSMADSQPGVVSPAASEVELPVASAVELPAADALEPEPLALEEVEPTAAADLDDVLGLTPEPSATTSESLPLELEPAEPEAAVELELPAELDISATATPVTEPEPTPVEPEPVAEAPVVEPPAGKGGRRGWKQWGTRQPSPKVEAPKPAPPARKAPEPVEPEPLELESEPLAASDPLELSEPLTSSSPAIDLSSVDEPEIPAEEVEEPVADAEAIAPTPVGPTAVDSEEPELPLAPESLEDSTDTAYAVEVSPRGGATDSAEREAARDEVTSSDLELSEVDEPHTLDLEASSETETSAVATESSPADDMFEGVDLDSLALDALNEPDTTAAETPAEPTASEPAEEVSATLDLAAATEPEAPPLDLSEPEGPAVSEDAPSESELELESPQAEAPAPEPELLTLADEESPKDEPPTPADETPPAPAGTESELPPPLTGPVKLKPSTRRRKRDDAAQTRRGPVRGKGGKFISAAEAEEMDEVSPPDQSATTDGLDEVLESTEPTPESALNFAPGVPSGADEIPLPADEPAPSDSVFGRAVQDLAGSSTAGELVDEAGSKPLSPFEQIVSDATHFVETDAPAPLEAVEVEPPAEPAPEIFEHESTDATDEIAAGELELSAPDEDHALDLSAEPEPMYAIEPEPESSLELMGEIEPAAAPDAEPETPLELPAIAEEPIAEPEPLPELSLSEEPPVENEAQLEEQPLDLSAPGEAELPPEPEAEVEPLSFDETFEPTESTSLAGDVALAEPSATDSEAVEPPVLEPTEPMAEAEPEVEAAPPAQPPHPGPLGFFGIVRDADTFLGGMPLHLPPLAPPPPTFGRVGVSFGQGESRNSHQAPPPPPLIIGADDDNEEPTAEAPAPAEDPPVIEPPADYTATGAPVLEAGSNDTTIAGPAIPVQETSATADAPAAPKMAVPPRPRRNRLADYEKRFAKVDEDKALEAMLREQNLPKAEQGPASSGFDGLTLGPGVRQTDVFSDAPATMLPAAESNRAPDPFLADKQASIDLAARNVAAGRVPPPLSGLTAGVPAAPVLEAPTNGADPFGPPVARKADLPSDQIDRNDRKPPRAVARHPAPAPDFNYTGPTRGARKLSIRVLVAAMVVFMIGAGVAGFLLTPVYTTLLAKTTFTNLKDRSIFDQHKFRTEQQTVLASEPVRSSAKAALADQYPNLSAGLLADPLAFDSLSRDLEWPTNSNEMRLKLKSVDPDGDKKRLEVLLKALYSENKHLIDVAALKKGEYDKAYAEVEQLVSQMNELKARIREQQNNVSDAPSSSVIAQTEQEAQQLSDLWKQAVDKVHQLQGDLERLAPNGGAAAPAVVDVAGGDPEKDPGVIQSREELKILQGEIVRLKALGSEEAVDTARKALDATINVYQDELTKVQAGRGPEWQDFLAQAKKLQGMALQLTGDIIARQRAEQEKLAEMKRKVEQEQVTAREKRFADDPELKGLIEQNRQATRWAKVAEEIGQAAEAARWKGEMEQTSAKIDLQKAKIGDDPEIAKRIAEVQKLIDEGQKSIANDRNTLDQQLAATFKDTRNAGGELVKKLNDQDKQAAEGLWSRAKDMVDANQTYGSLVNSVKSGDSSELRKKEADARQIAGAIEHRINEIKDKARKDKTELEAKAQAQRIDDTRSALAVAEKAEAEAGKKWLAKREELADLRNKAAIAKAADDKLQDNLKSRTQLESTIAGKRRELDDKFKTGTLSVVPEPVATDAVTEGPKDDDRWKFALIASMSVCGLFLLLIWLGGYHQVPTAVPAVHRPAIETASKEAGAGDDEALTV